MEGISRQFQASPHLDPWWILGPGMQNRSCGADAGCSGWVWLWLQELLAAPGTGNPDGRGPCPRQVEARWGQSSTGSDLVQFLVSALFCLKIPYKICKADAFPLPHPLKKRWDGLEITFSLALRASNCQGNTKSCYNSTDNGLVSFYLWNLVPIRCFPGS